MRAELQGVQELKYLGSSVQSEGKFVPEVIRVCGTARRAAELFGSEEEREGEDSNVQLQKEADDWLQWSTSSKGEGKDSETFTIKKKRWKIDATAHSLMVREAFLSALAVTESAFVANNRPLTRGGYFGQCLCATLMFTKWAVESLGHGRP